MTDKAIELAGEILELIYKRVIPKKKSIVNLIRPYLAPEYKYVQLPFSDHISAEGFTEAKLQPKKDADIQKALEYVERLHINDAIRTTTSDPIPDWHTYIKTLAAAYRELSAKYDRLLKIAKRQHQDLYEVQIPFYLQDRVKETRKQMEELL